MTYNNVKDSELLILDELKKELSFEEKILLTLLKRFVLKIYNKGAAKGFNWEENRWQCQRFVNHIQVVIKYTKIKWKFLR